MDRLIIGVLAGATQKWEENESKGFRLLKNELGYDKEKKVLKIGDGINKFIDLPSVGSFNEEYTGESCNITEGNFYILNITEDFNYDEGIYS